MPETYLFFGNSALRPIVIKNCNGRTSVPFGKAWIDCTRPSNNVPVTGIPFAFIFKEATDSFLDMILGLEKGGGDEQRPDVSILDDNKKAALACIKKYLTEDYGIESILFSIHQSQTKRKELISIDLINGYLI
jgi:hypothetical protein